jgi:predicted DNA-binding transcriptional regulator YafY
MPFTGTRSQNCDRARIARQVAALLLTLQNKRRMPHVEWLASELGVTTRTVYRYLNAVEQAGWPLPTRYYREA